MPTQQTHQRFAASRGGHAPGHLRQALLDCLDWNYEQDWFERLAEDPGVLFFSDKAQQKKWECLSAPEKAQWLCGQLWNCSDIVPYLTAEDFPLKRNTYAALVRHLQSLIAIAHL
jgi:hypothetical protein